LNTNYGAPSNFVSLRTSSNVRALVVPDSVNLRHLFEPAGGQASYL
jgi:hypothetical protein